MTTDDERLEAAGRAVVQRMVDVWDFWAPDDDAVVLAEVTDALRPHICAESEPIKALADVRPKDYSDD